MEGIFIMKILHTSDWHLGKMLDNVGRLNEQVEFINFLYRLCNEEKIDLILLAGDIYDNSNPSSAAEELFYDAMDRLSDKGNRPIVVVAGNHDSPDRLCAAAPIAAKHGIILLGYPYSDASEQSISGEGVELLEAGKGWLKIRLKSTDEKAVILTLPYPSEARLEQLLDGEKEGELQRAYSDKVKEIFEKLSENYCEDTVNLAISHLYVSGGITSDSERDLQIGGAYVVEPNALPQKAQYVALGHLHRPQQVKSAKVPAYYSGSPLAYSFSEVDYVKSVYIVEVEPSKEALVRHVNVEAGRPLKKWIGKEGLPQVLKWCEEGKDRNAWIDLEIYTDRPITFEEQKLIRSLNPGIINIRPKLIANEEEVNKFETREGKSVDFLFKEFYKSRVGTEPTSEILSMFMELLDNETNEVVEEMEVS